MDEKNFAMQLVEKQLRRDEYKYTADDLDRELYNNVLTITKGVFND